MSSYFVRHVRHYPHVFLPESREPPLQLVRRVDVRPGRFIVVNPRTKQLDWQVPEEFLNSQRVVGPLRAALYLGRVEDIDESGDSIEVEVWEVPNGREGTTTLTREELGGQKVEVGDTLEMYTWREIPLGSNDECLPAQARIHVEVTQRPPLTEEERQLLAALADTLESP